MLFWGPATLLKKIPTQALSYRICKHFKNNYFEEHLWTSAFKHYLKKRLEHRWFPVSFVNYLRTLIFWRIYKRLVLPVRKSFLNKVETLTAWRLLIALERDCLTVISLWILRNFLESFFAEHLLATTSHMMLFFSFLGISEVCSLKQFIWWSNGKWGEGFYKHV